MVELLAGVPLEKESKNAILACNDYLRLGAGRSIPKLIQVYSDKVNFSLGDTPPSTSETTLYKWSSLYSWDKRASLYDTEFERNKSVMRSNTLNVALALDYERIEKLNRLASLLEAQIYEQGIDKIFDNLWLRDYKQVKLGEDDFREREIFRFNAPLIDQYRGVLDDLAKETGGRVKRIDSEFDGKLVLQWPEGYDEEDDAD